MLSTLIRKQLKEIFKGYYINSKTGKARTKKNTTVLYVLFAFLMVMLCGVFFGLGYLLSPLFEAKLTWLFFAIMGIITVGLGVFGSVFNTYAGLYLAKDNDLLISMPIPPQTILLSRVASVMGMALLYCGCVWIPTIVCAIIFGNISATSIIASIIMFPVIILIVTTLTCLLGWLVAMVVGKFKNRSLMTVVASLVFFAVYYFVCMRLSDFIEMIVHNANAISNAMNKWWNIFFFIGSGAAGNMKHLCLISVIAIIATVLCYIVLSRTFLSIATKTQSHKKVVYKEKTVKTGSVKNALFQREWKHFLSSPTYMLNCGLGIIMLPILAVAVIWKREMIHTIIVQLNEYLPIVKDLIPLAIVAAVCMILSINVISTPSISLEGKTLWLVKSLPISAKEVFDAKVTLHVMLNGISGVISGAICCLALGCEYYHIVLACALIYIFVLFTGNMGLFIGLKRANFTWTSETTIIKQSLAVLLSWLLGWGIIILFGVAVFLLRNTVSMDNMLIFMIVILSLATRFVKNWMNTKGVEEFAKL